jgi:hypothetical protein
LTGTNKTWTDKLQKIENKIKEIYYYYYSITCGSVEIPMCIRNCDILLRCKYSFNLSNNTFSYIST